MTDYPLYLACIAILALFHRIIPRMRLPVVLAFWVVGVFLVRVAPALLGNMLPRDSQGLLIAYRVATWAGGMLLLRALDVLTFWDRPTTRWTTVAKWMMVAGILLGGLGGSGWPIVLAFPWVFTYRWRQDLGAAGLLLANLAGSATFIFMLIVFGMRPVDQPLLEGMRKITEAGSALALVHAIGSIPLTARRIHLSIKRIGPRLVGSHVLAGVIPVALTSLFLLLSSALFVSTYRGSVGGRYLQQMSRDMETDLRAAAAAEAGPAGLASDAGRTREVTTLLDSRTTLLVRREHEAARVLGPPLGTDPDSLLAVDTGSREAPLFWDGERLFVRSRIDTTIAGARLRMEALRQVDSLAMERVSRLAGVGIRVDPRLTVLRRGGGIQIGPNAEAEASGRDTTRTAIGPRPEGKRRLPGGSIIACLAKGQDGWTTNPILVSSSASFGEQLLALFGNARENPLSTVVLIVLGLIAVFFLGAIWVTVSMVLDMGRSITRAVRALTDATAALRAGNLGHRITLAGNDELWSVAANFNEMADGLERMRSMEREAQRLDEELRLAREIQNRLLPSEAPANEFAELAGLSLPAREIGGDYFDYIALDDGRVGIAVADVSGKGAPAALLMSTFRASLRSQDLGALGPAEVLGRINRFIHSSVDPGKFITAFLCLFDPKTGELRYANAGHDPPLLIEKDGTVTELTGGGLILGLLPQIAYEDASARIPQKSLMAIFTDGVTEAQNPAGDFFGAEGLTEVLRRHPDETCATLLQRAVEAINRFSDTRGQFDDITLVLARRH